MKRRLPIPYLAALAVALAFTLSTACAASLRAQTATNPFAPEQNREQDKEQNREQSSASVRKPAEVTYLFPEQLSLPADKASSVDLHFRVAAGLHVNSHHPHTEDLIPTTLKVPEDSGVQLVSAQFPAGADYTFAVSPSEKLNVYTGEFVIHAQLLASRGNHLIQATLRYQACNNEACMPPHSIPVVIDVTAK